MAQLSPDRFAIGHDVLTVEQAIAALKMRVQPVAAVETLPLAAALGRTLAHDLIAPLPLPPFANSAVDGYAVRFSDLVTGGETRLLVKGRIAAGAEGQGADGACAIRIFTGASMPVGFDTVFMQEDVTRDGDWAVLPPGLKKGANARPAGEDVAEGSVALPAGTVLAAQHIALAAALGQTQIIVRRALRVALFSTGNEVTEPGQPRPSAGIYDSNRALLRALCTRPDLIVTDLGILPDNRPAIAKALAAAQGHDVILTSGGVSLGEEDHVKAAVEDVGALNFWRMAIKPGRPVAMGTIGDAAFVGLPGNPVAVFVTFAAIVRPLMAALSGADVKPPLPLPVVAGFAYRKKAGRREYVRVTLVKEGDHIIANKHPRDGAGVLSSLTETDGLLVLPEDSESLAVGETAGFLAYAALL